MKGMKLYNRSTIYNLALKTFGPEAQALKLMEEAAELAAAAARNMNGLGSEVDLAGEDVGHLQCQGVGQAQCVGGAKQGVANLA